jgi:hypothetical protein
MMAKRTITPDDMAFSKAFLKSLDFIQSFGGEIAIIKTTEKHIHADPSIYIQSSEGRVLEAFVRPQTGPDTRFIDYCVYNLNDGDYQEWNASSLEMFCSALDEEILENSKMTEELPIGMSSVM